MRDFRAGAFPGARATSRGATRAHTIAARALTIAAMLAAATASTHRALAKNPSEALPEWAVPIVDHANAEAVPESKEDPPPKYRILYTETRMAVAADGKRTTRQRSVSQIISPTDRIHVSGFSLQGDAKMTLSRAWHVRPGERAAPVTLPPVDVTSQHAFLTDVRSRMIGAPNTKRGSLVVFEFEAVETLPALGWSIDFYDDVEVDESRFVLETPAGWPVRTDWLRVPPPPMMEDDNVRSWRLRDLRPPGDDEPFGESATDRSPLLVVNIEPPQGSPAAAVSITDWPAMAAWYDRVVKGRAAVTPQIQAAAKRALDADARATGAAATGDGAGFFEKVRAEGRYVRDAIRYLDIEVGVGGWQPRPAADTLSNLYGDCKDKAMLLSALLYAEGISSWPVAINATRKTTAHPTIPAVNAFNHVVNAVPIPAGAKTPAWAEGAVVDAGDLGRVLIVDTTHEENAIGALPENLAGKSGLIAADRGGRLVTLPAGTPAGHRVDRRFSIDVHPDRSLDVTSDVRFTGTPAAIARTLRENSEKEMRLRADRRILSLWADAKSRDYALLNETPDGAFAAHLSWTVPPLGAGGYEATIPLFPDADGALPHLPLAHRKRLIDLGFPQTVRYETTVTGLGPNVELPEPRTLQGDGWRVATTYVRDEASLKATWETTLTKPTFEPGSFDDLRRLYVAMRVTGDESIQLP